jgi:hypothetical protein
MLRFWCGPDAERIDRLFRASGCYRSKWDRDDYRERTISKALEGECYDAKRNERVAYGGPKLAAGTQPDEQGAPGAAAAAEAKPAVNGVNIILEWLRHRYHPTYRTRHAICCEDGSEVTLQVVTPNSVIIEALEKADDAPRYAGGNTAGAIKKNSLPGFFSTWVKVAWGDLLSSLPDEDNAELGQDSPAREEFRRLVRDALLTEVTMGDTIGHSTVTQVERRSLIDWCRKWAKPGRWKDVRKPCWCKLQVTGDGEERLMVAIQHGLFAQLRADRRLTEMRGNTFTRRAQRYDVGAPGRDDRPCGQRALILHPEFIGEMLAGAPPDEETEGVDHTVNTGAGVEF